ncbi:MAG: alpha-hydroxy acid oxidase [Desulfobacterales bacterium]|jgi:isopentenyl diphosphate isomerase/L-lactate dehydrogenase-like FMN-dependent dehydrogenase|nr:alpha-hydroxy acid oxidase [Desulfobacterales bacterium]MDP6682613.1 alpha-hydroxy acid oxidase [Desulfobacterales bacterium]MDP6808289.1 alpha-hydroxy acid oxidase [Desulfobacterales bacterium]|tara:strand:- start:8385 stop:9341 length:957 start_codon:yes stop_codon:yes gene_type:complete
MELTEIYEKGGAALRAMDIGFLLDGVETEFVKVNNRRILDGFTLSQRCIDGVEAATTCHVLGVDLSTPLIMSAMTMPIPAIADDGLMKVAEGLKAAGSLMWVGTPIPQNLKELAAIGVPLVANVKPFQDRKKMFEALDDIQAAGVQWIGVEIDAGQGTKIKDRQMAKDCFPLSLEELKAIRKAVSLPLIFKGVLSRVDAKKSIEAGADGIVVSNHGAHTLDYLPHPFQVMDEIMEEVTDNTVVVVDGGFRRGSDALKGLAFGASLVGLGRPILFGLAADENNGVEELVGQITGELKRMMCMVGAADPGGVGRDILIES